MVQDAGKWGNSMKISLDKTIKAMSIALDLGEISSEIDTDIIEKVSNINYTEHKFLHHSKRTTYIAIKIAQELNIDKETLKLLYLCATLHDIGAINGLNISHNSETFIVEHCRLGSEITIPFPQYNNLSKIILYHHENYNGSGPFGLKGDQIPIESQIIRISDLIEVQYKDKEPSYLQRDRIIQWVNNNKGKLFCEKIANAFLKVSQKDIFWFDLENLPIMDFILDKISPKLDLYLNLQEFQSIATIFSNIIDSKSSFTATHSHGIAELCYSVSKYLNYDEEKCIKMKIAGLLHDIGKLAIPCNILNKNGSLTKEEFSIIKSHSYYTKIILDKIEDIPDISDWASNHHEKLNGSGYPRGLDHSLLCEESKILGVCDIYQALTEDRPYRKGLSVEKAFSILDNMVVENNLSLAAVNYLKNTLNYNI